MRQNDRREALPELVTRRLRADLGFLGVQLVDILTGAEGVTAASQHDHAHRCVLFSSFERGQQRFGHRLVEGIAGIGPVECDDRDAVADLVAQRIGK